MPALVGQVVAVTVGEFADKAMIAQEAKVPTDASGELLVSTPSTPEGAAEFLAQTGIGDARDGEGRIAEGLEQQTVFATEIQSADPAALMGPCANIGRE